MTLNGKGTRLFTSSILILSRSCVLPRPAFQRQDRGCTTTSRLASGTLVCVPYEASSACSSCCQCYCLHRLIKQRSCSHFLPLYDHDLQLTSGHFKFIVKAKTLYKEADHPEQRFQFGTLFFIETNNLFLLLSESLAS